MGRKRPRSKRSPSLRPPAEGESEGERVRLRRNRPLTWRSALPLLVPLALLAVGSDVALYGFVSDHYARHGHLGIRLDIAAMAFGFTGLAVYACIAVRKEVRKGSGGRQAVKPPDATARNRERKEQQ